MNISGEAVKAGLMGADYPGMDFPEPGLRFRLGLASQRLAETTASRRLTLLHGGTAELRPPRASNSTQGLTALHHER